MFIAVADLRFAKGRFALLGGVIALMTLMVVLLTGLTAGLGAASVSAVEALPVDRIGFADPGAGQDISFATSTLPSGTADEFGGTAHPIGVSTGRLSASDGDAAVSLLGTDPAWYPPLAAGTAPGAGEVAVTADLADDQALSIGDDVRVGDTDLTVAAITETTSFNHLPVVYTPIADWQAAAHTDAITAVGIVGDPPAVDGVTVVDRDDAFDAVGGYASEQGSLTMMRGLLLVVSALIVGAFFTVWTMQRAPDLAVVRAIGAGRGYLLRDALAQAGLVLVAGSVLGGAAAVGIGLLAAQVMPFVVSGSTVAVPLAAMAAVGIVGAAVSVRRVSTVDPITALGAVR